jgi:hypothetical protein
MGPAYKPTLAQLGPLPPPSEDDAWGYEMKWDGVRALAYVEGDLVTPVGVPMDGGDRHVARSLHLPDLAGNIGGVGVGRFGYENGLRPG